MGNIQQVRAALSGDDERIATINNRRQRDPFFAEIKPDTPAQWHVVTTHPAAENLAAAHLSARRFGIYVPTFLDVRPGHRTVRRPLFPGYVLTFVWDIHAHWRRICSVPGVASILMDREEHAAVLPDDWVRMVQRYEIRSMTPEELGLTNWRKVRSRKRKKVRVEQEETSKPVDNIVSVSCYSALAGIEKLDDERRVSVLHQALGLPHASSGTQGCRT